MMLHNKNNAILVIYQVFLLLYPIFYQVPALYMLFSQTFSDLFSLQDSNSRIVNYKFDLLLK